MSEIPLIKQFLKEQGSFMAYLMAMTRDFAAAEEIFQNAAVVVMEKSASDETIRDFRAWAKEVVRRQALAYLREDQRRTTRLRPVAPELLQQITRTFLEDDTADRQKQQELDALASCVEEVADPVRSMLVLRYERQASFEHIATAVEKTPAAVQRALCRLRKSLRVCVQSKLGRATEALT